MLKKSMAALMIAAVLSTVAYAAVVNISWENAAQNTDGSAIPASGDGSLVNTIVEYGPCNAARDGLASVTGTITTPSSQLAAATPNLPPGVWCAHARHTNTYGEVSAWTATGVKDIARPVPGAPRNFSFGS